MATKEMLISDLLNLHEDVASILMRSGMGCVGCPSARFESLEQAGVTHDIDVAVVINEINALLGK